MKLGKRGTESDLDCHVSGQRLVETKWCSAAKKRLEATSLSSYVRINVE
jgi:hypothetical protein